jgi:acyl-ACP thioesterase
MSGGIKMNMKNSSTGISLVKREFTVQVYELDMNSKATMASICNYLQETGITHGIMLMDKAGISADDLVFVLTRLQVKMLRYPLWKEKVVISTWLSPIINRYAIRNFIIETENGETLGLGINSAVPFNLKNRSGSNIEIDVSGVETLEKEAPLPHIFEKLESPAAPQFTASIAVSYSHCDLYRHVNNVKYIEWCLDTVPENIYRSHELHEVDINFRSEGNCGDILTVSGEQSENNSPAFIHGICNSSTGRELVRMKSLWKEK